MSSVRLAVFVSLALSSTALAQSGPQGTPVLTTVVGSGDPSNRVDILLVGEGFSASQQAKFTEQAQRVASALLAQEPFKEYGSYINVHRLNVVSRESGADHPERSPAVYRDTALNVTYKCSGIERAICTQGGGLSQVLALVPLAQRDAVLIVVNDATYGGAAMGAIATASLHSSFLETVAHELGHALGRLGDEYDYGSCSVYEPFYANASTVSDRNLVKWAQWIDPLTPVPSSAAAGSVPGIYEGANYCPRGVYRPTFDSKMRTLRRPYEQINTEALVKRFYDLVSPVEARSPASSLVGVALGATQRFTITPMVPQTHGLSISWFVDGVLQPAEGNTFDLRTQQGKARRVTVEALVRDGTAMVRNDPAGLLMERIAWSVDVGEPECIIPGNSVFRGCYYDNVDLSALKLTRDDAAIQFSWGGGSPLPAIASNDWSATWLGYFPFDASEYEFALAVDDGARLYIDGERVLDEWRRQSTRSYVVRKTLSAGQHLIRLEYMEGVSSASARLSWKTTFFPGASNVAFFKPVTSSAPPTSGALVRGTDGDITSGRYVALKASGPQYFQIDLGEEHFIYGVRLWNYWADGRIFRDVVVQASNDPSFPPTMPSGEGNGGPVLTGTLFNNDGDGSAGLGRGTDAEYAESAAGKSISARVPTRARYLRVWSSGSNRNSAKVLVEVEAWGRPTGRVPTESGSQPGGEISQSGR